jgi:PIN domain nuclease of toxin-antitoxin system
VKAVLDASALLAYLQDEPGSETIEPMLDESAMDLPMTVHVVR